MTDLSGADLTGAHLSGADLTGAVLHGAHLGDVRTDEATRAGGVRGCPATLPGPGALVFPDCS